MTMASTSARGAWKSRFGFVLAAAGSAIGLGNIWRFPYVVGENGGAAFVLVYLAFVFLIGAPVMLAELSLGRYAERNPVGAFSAVAPGSVWRFVGLLGVITGVGILSFYGVIAGWTFGYFLKTLAGSFNQTMGAEQSAQVFTDLVSDWRAAVGLLLTFLILTAVIVWRGVSNGIELMSKILMPVLLFLLILLAVRSITLSGAGDGLRFYLAPDFSKIRPQTVPTALGQAFFSLSLGMGAMITYGSYIGKSENLVTSTGLVCLFDTLIALLAGLIIFPALFHAGLDPASGVGLVFQVLPPLFASLPAGQLFGAAFFLLLTIAALTSTISLLEVPVSYLIDEWKWSRGKAVIVTTAGTMALGLPSALAFGAVGVFTLVPGAGMDFLTLMSVIFGNYSLSVGSLLLAVFVGYRWGVAGAAREIQAGGIPFGLRPVWSFLIRFLCPVAVAIIIVYIVWTGNYF
jgi:NSS family neurotransmitter:Na+ symporter